MWLAVGLESHFLLMWGLPVSILMTQLQASSRASDSRGQSRGFNTCYHLVSAVTYCHFYQLLVAQGPLRFTAGWTWGQESPEPWIIVGNLGGWLPHKLLFLFHNLLWKSYFVVSGFILRGLELVSVVLRWVEPPKPLFCSYHEFICCLCPTMFWRKDPMDPYTLA